MKKNLKETTVKAISYLIDSNCLRADSRQSLETLVEMLGVSNRYKIYLEDESGRLSGILQAKQIAMEILRFSRSRSEMEDMIPAISFVMNSKSALELAEEPATVRMNTTLETVLEMMEANHIREIAVVDESGELVGTLEAKNILSHYLAARSEAERG